MKHQIIKFIKKHQKIFAIAKIVIFLRSSALLKIDGGKKKYPKIIQLPITYKCNSNCVMCNICRMDHNGEFTIEEFSKFMKDDVFKKVESVGINGGEPSLVPNLYEYAKEILKLPSLKSLNIISNGFNKKPFLKNIEKIYELCKKRNVHFHVAISLDGVNNIHNIVRGMPHAFEKTISTIDEIVENKYKYCDSYDLGCTITRQNVNRLTELDVYAKNKKYNIKYRLGIANKRIESDKLMDNYSVIYSPLKQSAKEFFHYQISQTKDLESMFKYFSIFYWLNNPVHKRLLGCMWQDEGITIDSRGEVYYCAVASDSIGSLRKNDGEEIFFADKNIEYRKGIIANECDGCIHDYSGRPWIMDVIRFVTQIVRDRFAIKIYEIKVKFIL